MPRQILNLHRFLLATKELKIAPLKAESQPHRLLSRHGGRFLPGPYQKKPPAVSILSQESSRYRYKSKWGFSPGPRADRKEDRSPTLDLDRERPGANPLKLLIRHPLLPAGHYFDVDTALAAI